MSVIKKQQRTHYKVTSVALDRDGIAASQALTEATPMTLAGVLTSGGTYTAGDGQNCRVGHLIAVYSGSDINTVVFTIVGTDPDGLALSETVTGVNNSTVTTTKYFYTVTSVTPSATSASVVEVGITNTWATQRVPIIQETSSFAVGMGVEVSGTISVSAQLTMSDIYDPDVTPTYIADTTLATKSATFFSALGVFCTAVRLIQVSSTGTPTVYFHVIQNR